MLKKRILARRPMEMIALATCVAMFVFVGAVNASACIVWFEGGDSYLPYTELVADAAHGGRALLVDTPSSSNELMVIDGTLYEAPAPYAPYTEKSAPARIGQFLRD